MRHDQPRVFRAPMRSRRDDVPAGAAVERALALGLCGFGGRLEPAPTSLSLAVVQLADVYGESAARRLERFARVEDGAFVWTRDVDGLAWLGRVSGPWRYDSARDAHDVDLVHVRPCEWSREPVAEPQVPAAVQATFRRGGRNWQETHDRAVSAQSFTLWNERVRGADAAASAPRTGH